MKNSNRAICGVVLVFVLGVLCGALAMHLRYTYRIESILSGRTQTREETIVNRLNGRLDLDERQEEQVRAIVHDTHEQIKALRSQLRPQTEAIIEKSQVKIAAILTPEQRKKYDQMIAERKAKFQR